MQIRYSDSTLWHFFHLQAPALSTGHERQGRLHMHRNHTLRLVLSLLLLNLLAISPSFGDEILTTESGMRVKVYDNGLWAYEARPERVRTSDGQLLQLLPNGRWELMSEEPAGASPAVTSQPAQPAVVLTAPANTRPEARQAQQSLPSELQIELDKLTIESKMTKLLKTKKWERQSVFDIRLQLDSKAGSALALPRLKPSQFTVRTIKDKDFPVLWVSELPAELAPGQSITFSVRTQDGPLWYYRKALILRIAAGALFNSDVLELSIDMAHADEKEVDAFPVE